MTKAIDFRYNLKVYWSLLRKYKVVFFFLLFLIMLIEASHVLDQFLFKKVIDYSTIFSEGGTQEAFMSSLAVLGAVFVFLFLSRAVIKFVYVHLLNKMESDTIYDMKRQFFSHIIGLSHNFHTTNKTGSLISRLVRGGSAMEGMTDILIFNIGPLVFKLVVTVIVVWLYSPTAAILILSAVVLYLAYSLWLQTLQEPSSVERNDTEDLEKAITADFLTNIDSIKYFGREQEIVRRYEMRIGDSSKSMRRHWNFFRWADSGQTLILGTTLVLLVWHSTNLFAAGEISLGSMAFIYTSYIGLLGPLFGFLHGVRRFYQAMADFEVLFKYGKTENEIKDAPDAAECKITKGSIEYRDVTFSYGKRKVFDKLNLKIARGQKVALVGHSGSGKTTLVKLLYRLYDVNGGAILVDGKDIRSFKQESLRSEMTIVPQEAALFDDTIWNNIAFSNDRAGEQEIRAAIKFAQLDKIIAEMPEKEQTIVGERGVRLSGGEKQRVSIARALLADKKILVLDEATSALDSQTEHDIQRDLQQLMKGRTSVIIAHRLSTIMHADAIVVLEKGKIVQTGTHKELVRRKGHYQKLWKLQKGGFIA